MSLKASDPPAQSAAARTRRALLEAAVAVFDEQGFRTATTRDICERAGANGAAIHYHFGSKERLYLEALRHAEEAAIARHPLPGPRSPLPPPAHLAAFVAAFLRRILDLGAGTPGGRMFAREMVEPTPALDVVAAEYLQPLAEEVRAIVTRLLGPAADEQSVRLCGISIVSQCFFYHHCRPALARLFPDLDYREPFIERLARHITDFSLAGVADAARRLPAKPRNAPAKGRHHSPRHARP